ncbi:putative exonuclease [Selenomonas ruminantium subsp. lactilytica TAM6421]|uniref:Nuclease SbcCD subunit D n=1 Tax=Selenomonas ruminantium subsp. lactilytica (strain NBRC 103574 / TAM6421) TaxID=927704 RepID=I0GUQ9_SELRL|nr:exonuclease SbcCD subunit D [Selenomonas ruminantium]BAL84496.1 putative exonuclease [Selenomonas ruminantium subsp. lactilytica TAM6421]
MKFFHLSDLHIGLKLLNHDLREDQQYILQEIVAHAAQRQPDAVVIAGDIYDKAVPSAEAVSLFDEFITNLCEALPQAEIMLISGNHDSAPRVNVFRSLLARHHLHMIGLPPMEEDETIAKVTLQDDHGPVNFYLLPFVKPSMVKAITGTDENGNNLTYDAALHALVARETIDKAQRNVLVSHQFYLSTGGTAADILRSDSEIITVGNIDAINGDILEQFDYAALGHIHKPQQLNGQECYRYCGTPLACSISEAGQNKGIIEVELGAKGTVTTTLLPLTPLHPVRKLKDTLKNILAMPSEDYVSITLTDKEDLDVFDMQDRLREAFPNLLEIRRAGQRQVDYGQKVTAQDILSPFDLCKNFLGDLGLDEEQLLTEIINEVQQAR